MNVHVGIRDTSNRNRDYASCSEFMNSPVSPFLPVSPGITISRSLEGSIRFWRDLLIRSMEVRIGDSGRI